MRIRYKGQYIRVHVNGKGEASMNGEFWELLRRLNDEGVAKHQVLQQIGFVFPPEDSQGLSQSQFVIPGVTKFKCIRCGGCCRNLRGGCPIGEFKEPNICNSYATPHPGCRRFPFKLLNARPFKDVLMAASFCRGLGEGDVIDKLRYGDIVSSLHAPPPKGFEGSQSISFNLRFDQFQNKWVFER
jgi:hypothetical protein